MSESAYNSPLLARKLPDSCFSSPARSIASLGDPNSYTDSELTETESESFDLATEVPGQPDQTVVDGWVKFRDNKRVSDHTDHFQKFLEYSFLSWHGI